MYRNGAVWRRARATADAVTDEVQRNGVELVLHVGDISYANGDPEVSSIPPIVIHANGMCKQSLLSVRMQNFIQYVSAQN